MAAAGQFNEWIELFKPTIQRNEYGQEKQSFVKYYTTRCKVEHNTGSKNIENNEIVHNYDKRLHIRYYVHIDDDYQIKYNGKFYRITSIENVREWNEKIIEIQLINE